MANERKFYHGVLKQALAHVTNHGMLASGALLLHLCGQEVRMPGSPAGHLLVGCCRPFCKPAPAPCSLLELCFDQSLKLNKEEGRKVLFPFSLATNDPF